MTEIIDDAIDVALQIGTESSGVTDSVENSFENDAIFWEVVEMRTEISQASEPNFAKGKVVPRNRYGEEIQEIISGGLIDSAELEDTFQSSNGFSRLVGSHFRLEVSTEFVSVDSSESENKTRSLVEQSNKEVEEDTLLFNGRLANISPIGTNLFEVTAYGPGQNAFNNVDSSGSLITQKLDLRGEEIGFIENDAGRELRPFEFSRRVEAPTIIRTILDEAGIDKRTVIEDDLQGTRFSPSKREALRKAGAGVLTQPDDKPIRLFFRKAVVSVEDALNRIKEQANTEYWFDKTGEFYFASPNNEAVGSAGSQVFEINLITDTSAGMKTPPYQSVKVIAPAVDSVSGDNAEEFISDDDEKLIVTANIVQSNTGEEETTRELIQLDPDNLQSPTFEYINSELVTDEQAENTAISLANEFIKQQASGKVTITGMPEIQIFDGILMPNTKRQPMGGQLYGVQRVIHKLNSDDGFLTEIEVGGPTDQVREIADLSESDLSVIPTPVDTDDNVNVVTEFGEKRAHGPSFRDSNNNGIPDRLEPSRPKPASLTADSDSDEDDDSNTPPARGER